MSPVIARVRSQLKACADDLELPGDIDVKVTIAPGGRVTSVVVQTGGKTTLDKCVTRALEGTTFPKTRNGGSFTKIFNFL